MRKTTREREAIPGPPRPFLKWAGGKTQLLDELEPLFPPVSKVRRYLEPFVGSGAVFFHILDRLQPKMCILADGNEELINAYRVTRDEPAALIRALAKHRSSHSKAHYYEVRGRSPARMTDVARAARLIYLNKTCFNGLYRVNSRGLFNVPMGRYVQPRIFDEPNLIAVSRALKKVRLRVAHFRETLGYARRGDFIYFDPPYHPLSPTSSFTSYSVNGGRSSFGASDQEELADVFSALTRRGCSVMLSNSDCPLIRRLYRGFDVRTVLSRRSINSDAGRRGRIREIVVLGYAPPAKPDALVQLISDERGDRRRFLPDASPAGGE